MILTIDIGNSNIMLGGFEGEELAFVVSISTDTTKTADEYASTILGVLAAHRVESKLPEGAIISSVVPPLNSVLRDAVKLLFGIETLTVGPGVRTGINIHCDTPSSVGADLICACVAVHHRYGSPALILDMGTATKLTVVGEGGSFEGVSILPGLMMGVNSLSENTAQLPKVELTAPKSVVGKNTSDSMRSGILFGNAAMVDGMIDRIHEELGRELPVYATGGVSHLVVPHCKHTITSDEYLILRGLYFIYHKNK